MFDLIIEKGLVIDGTGAPALAADIGIKEDMIEAVEDLAGAKAARRLNASGMIVAPGFIDIHTHSELELMADGRALSMLYQGVTTNVTGNCGMSVAPISDQSRVPVQFAMATDSYGIEWSWHSFKEWLDALRSRPISINVVPLVGHGTIRATAMGFDDRHPSDLEMKTMERLTYEAMDAGAFGISTGLVYPPGIYSDTPELVALAKVVANFHGLYASHIRGEAYTLLQAVTEALAIGNSSGVKVEISHHKAAGKSNWGKVRDSLALIEAAAMGQDVTYDLYPYRAGNAGLGQLLPPWAHAGGTEILLERLSNDKDRKQIYHDMIHGCSGWANFFPIDWEDIRIASLVSQDKLWMEGLSVAEIATQLHRDPVELVMDLVYEEANQVSMVNFVISPEDIEFLLLQPLAMIGSDGRAVSPGGPTGYGHPHPRYYGTFPRVLSKYVRGKGLLTWEVAIHKMTGMPAAKLGLDKRGLISPGCYADITVFDPDTIWDRATFSDPHQLSTGVEWVLVNGHIALSQGTPASDLKGRVLAPSH
ncbi:MAG: D-aminoacylase [Firmicutes bacterium]|nr:D-aminoacylase [Bacillota bacterium]